MQPDPGAESGGSQGQALPPLPSPERIQALLFDAAKLGRIDVIPALIQAGANIDATDAKGHTPLILSSYHGHAEATRLLLRLGATVDAQDRTRGNTALMGVAFKGHADIARWLLASGADVNMRNHAGQTALMMAALFGHVDIVEALLSNGANVEDRDLAGNSAVTVAEMQGNGSMLDVLKGQSVS